MTVEPANARERVKTIVATADAGERGILRFVPNALSTIRLVLAAIFPLASLSWRPAIVVLGAFSDLADGFIARRFGVTSWVGGILDAVADKVFVLTVLVTLAVDGHIARWLVPLLLGRDLVVGGLALRAVLLREWTAFREMPARPLGKVTTASMFIMFFALVARPGLTTLGIVLIVIAAVTSVAAAVDYLVCFLRSPWGRSGRGESAL